MKSANYLITRFLNTILLMMFIGVSNIAYGQTEPSIDDTQDDRTVVYNLPLYPEGTNVTLMGKGTGASPYQIGSTQEWDAYATIVNIDGGNFASVGILTADITFTGNHQQPGEDENFSFTHTYKSYCGYLKGEGHTITLCQQETGGKDNIPSKGGLFGDIRSVGIRYLIQDLKLAGTIRTTKSPCGAVASTAYNMGRNVINCQSSVEIIWASDSEGTDIGGFFGKFDHAENWTFENCLVDGCFLSVGGKIKQSGGYIGQVHVINMNGNHNWIMNSFISPHAIDAQYENFYTFGGPNNNLSKSRAQTSYYLFPDSKVPAEQSTVNKGNDAAGMTADEISLALNGSDEGAWIAHHDTLYLKTFAHYFDIEGWACGETPNAPVITGDHGNEVTLYYKEQGADDHTYTTDCPTTAGHYTMLVKVSPSDTWNGWTSAMDFTITQGTGSISYDIGHIDKFMVDESFINPLTIIGDGSVRYTSENESVATVDETTGEVTIHGTGSTTITATVTDTENYAYSISTASYNLKVDFLKVTISSVGYATLYYSDRALMVPEGVTAKTYKVVDGKLAESKTYEAGSVIPKGEAVVLKGAKGDYKFYASTTTEQKDADNKLKGSDGAEDTTGGTLYYALTLNKQNDPKSVGFYWMNETGTAFTNGAHRAYLALDGSLGGGAQAKSSYLFSEAATDINSAETVAHDAFREGYNLNGQRVSQGYRGIVIVNGRKFIAK